MLIDIHVHICPPEVREDRGPYLEGEPDFAAIYKDPKAKLAGASELVQKMDEQGVDKSVVFGFPWRKEKNYRLNNDYVLEAAKRYPNRLIPFCCLAADSPKAALEVKRCQDLGIKGIGELGFYQTGLDENARKALKPIADLSAAANIPILLHTNEPVGHYYSGKSPMNLKQLYELIQAFPQVTWILAHAGGGLPFFAQMKKEVQEVLANCWFDTAALPFLFKPKGLQLMLQALGKDKFLFGTDFPLLPPSRYYRYFEAAEFSQEQKDTVLGKNAARLFGLKENS